MSELSFGTDTKISGKFLNLEKKGVPDPYKTKIELLLSKKFGEIEEDEMYSNDDHIDFIKQVLDDIGVNPFRLMAASIVEYGDIPDVDDYEEALEQLNDFFASYTNEDELRYYSVLSISEVKVRSRSPFPCEFDQAIISALAGKYTDSMVAVSESGDSCRKDGETSCQYTVNVS